MDNSELQAVFMLLEDNFNTQCGEKFELNTCFNIEKRKKWKKNTIPWIILS